VLPYRVLRGCDSPGEKHRALETCVLSSAGGAEGKGLSRKGVQGNTRSHMEGAN